VNDFGYGGDVHETRFEGGNWWDADLSTLGYSGEPDQGNVAAFGYVRPDDLIPRVVFVGQDQSIHELRLQGGWMEANLSSIANVQGNAGSTPFPFLTQQGGSWVPRVVYRGNDLHIHELHLLPGQGWQDADLSVLANGPSAGSVPFGYVTPKDSIPRVIYCDSASGSHIQELRLQPGQGWMNADLSQLAGGPLASGVDPSAYITRDLDPHVTYLGADSHIHDLWLPSGQGWTDTDLTGKADGPNGNSMANGYVGLDSVPRVVYFAEDNRVHQLSLEGDPSNTAWIDEDLFQNVINPPPSGTPTEGVYSAPFPYLVYGNPSIVFGGSLNEIHLLTQVSTRFTPGLTQISVRALELSKKPSRPLKESKTA